jgi:hypothetical protein
MEMNMRDPFVEFDPKQLPRTSRNAALVLSAVLIVGGILFGFAAAGALA